MNNNITQIIIDFNNTLLSLAHNIASVCPKSIIGTNVKDIDKSIRNKENFTKFIDLFCIKVLQYKKKIDEGDEEFFMEKDYKSDLSDVSDSNESYLNHVISLKSVWGLLKNENKQIVMMNMKILCELSQQYYEYMT